MQMRPEVVQEYAGYKTWKMKGGVVYGPFATRRQGQSVGINLLPADLKVCSFNCVYCQCGWTDVTDPKEWAGLAYPPPDEVARQVEEGFGAIHAAAQAVDTIVMSGNGEPTLYPWLDPAVDLVLAARRRFFPRAQVSTLSNGTGLGREQVRRAINKLDERIIKLDAGSEKTLRRIDIPLVPFTLDQLEEWVKGLTDVTLQCFFSQGRIDNTLPEEVDPWIARVGRIRPRYVQMYGLDRIPPLSGLRRVPRERLEQIALLLKERSGIEGRVF